MSPVWTLNSPVTATNAFLRTIAVMGRRTVMTGLTRAAVPGTVRRISSTATRMKNVLKETLSVMGKKIVQTGMMNRNVRLS